MQEVFEKIKERLEEKKSKYQNLADSSNFDGWHEEDIKYTAKADMCEEIIEIVNQVAEEYEQEVCEWKVDNKFDWVIKSPHENLGMIKEENGLYHYCPYCGKKIKVVE